MGDRISYDDKGGLDEVVRRGVNFHLEYMDDNTVWISLIRKGKPETVIWLTSIAAIEGKVDIDP